jgi:putative hydrolase of the HAD superfamily
VALDLQYYFQHVVTSQDYGVHKPDPLPFRKALELLEAEPAEALMVGDWAERDIEGAKRLGIQTAWAKYGDTHEVKDSGADYVLGDVLELLDIVKKENSAEARL